MITNPVAGGGRALDVRPKVLDALTSAGWTIDDVVPSTADEVTELAAAVKPDDIVITLGGDGVIARAADGVLRSGAILAPIGAGRGNDLLRALGIERDPVKAALTLAERTEQLVDIGVDTATGRAFLGVASAGYDSVTNMLANEMTMITGPLVYVVSGVRAIVSARKRQLTVTVDGETHRITGWNVAVGNSGRYGGGIKICPDARLDDGMLDLVVAGQMSRIRFALSLIASFAGAHLRVGRYHTWQGREISIDVDDELVVFADGDPFTIAPASFGMRSAKLRMLV